MLLSKPILDSTISPQFPIEICEKIIDALGRYIPQSPLDTIHVAKSPEDWDTAANQGIFMYDEDPICIRALYSCALTCKAWLPRSIIVLYRTVILKRSDTAAAMILGLARMTPSLAISISYLTLDPESGIRSLRDAKLYLVPYRLAGCTRYVQDIHTLRLDKESLDGAPPDVILRSLSSFRSITTLLIHRAVFDTLSGLIRLLLVLPSLHHLNIFQIRFKKPQPSNLTSRIRRPLHLQTLAFRFSIATEFVRWLISSRSLSNIQLLEIALHGGEDIAIHRLIQTILSRCGESLKHVRIYLHSSVSIPTFNFSPNPSLQTITLGKNSVSSVTLTLSTILSPNLSVIELLGIEIYDVQDIETLANACRDSSFSTVPRSANVVLGLIVSRNIVDIMSIGDEDAIVAKSLDQMLVKLQDACNGKFALVVNVSRSLTSSALIQS